MEEIQLEAIRSLKVIYRPMVAEDIPSLVAIDALSNSPPWTQKMFEEELVHPYSFNQVIQVRDKLVAFVIARTMGGRTEIMELAVHPDYRRQGEGTILLDYVIGKAADSDARRRRIELEVREDNLPAISFYKKNGFKMDGRRKGYYSDCDGILMSCNLP